MHIHTVLSPCGGLDMSPVKIIDSAREKNLDIIAVTDHNSTLHCLNAWKLGKKYGIEVIAGVEVNTKEEIHCLAYFGSLTDAELFQEFIDNTLPRISNKPEYFGYQFIVDDDENITASEERLLMTALDAGIDEIEKRVHSLNGLFIPAHVNRNSNSVYSQLGFIPADLSIDALELRPDRFLSDFISSHPEISGYSLVQNSDAHCIDAVGSVVTMMYLETPEFDEIRMALKGLYDRKTAVA